MHNLSVSAYRGTEAYLSCPLISIELESVRSNSFQGADPENVRKNGLTYQEAAHLTPLRAHSRCCEARIFRNRSRYARVNVAKHVKQMVFLGDDVSTHAHGAEELYFLGTAATDSLHDRWWCPQQWYLTDRACMPSG